MDAFNSTRINYSTTRRVLSMALGVACSITLTSSLALANGAMPVVTGHAAASGWHSQRIAPALVPVVRLGQQAGLPQPNHVQSVQQAFRSLLHANPSAFHHMLPAPATNNGANLNLTSTQLNFLAGNLANFTNLTIDVGGRQRSVALDTKLTGAELVAVQQKLTSGTQTIEIGRSGNATGGSIALDTSFLNVLNNSVGGNIGSLTVSRGVTVIDSVGAVNFGGKLVNFGSIFTAAAAPNSTDTIGAHSIYNLAGGTIASYNGGGNLTGADVALNAATVIANAGTISSNNNISMTAPVIINTGMVSALAGNINLAGKADLNVGGNGVWQANNGNINFASGNSDINVIDANLFSQQVNFRAGAGNVYANLGQATGIVNACGNNVVVNASTPDLQLGQMTVSGDPLISNAAGDITIVLLNPGPTNGAPLSLVASGNILCNAGNLDTSSLTRSGGNLTVIAGAHIDKTTGGGIKVSGPSATGGNIDLTGGGGLASINTASGYAGGPGVEPGDGGNILMVAYAGSTPGSGTITTASTTAGQTRSVFGKGGSVNIIAGNPGTTAVSLSSPIDLTGGNGMGGNVNIAAATPTGSISFSSDGTASGTIGAGALNNAAVFTGGLKTGGGNVTINTKGLAQLGVFGGVTSTDGYPILPPNPGDPGYSAGNVTVNAGAISVVGGGISAYGKDGAFGGNGTPASLAGGAGGKGGNGGNITLTASSISVLANIISHGEDGGDGGDGTSPMTGNGGAGGAGGAGGNGGTIKLTANGAGGIVSSAWIYSEGGAAGLGGNGGDGANSLSGSGGNGGAGGKSGTGGNGGAVTLASTGTGVMSLTGGYVASYGNEGGQNGTTVLGTGGVGGRGGTGGGGAGGNGGAGGAGGAGGNGGAVTVTAASGKITVGNTSIVSEAGGGGNGGAGNIGGNGSTKGGNGAAGGAAAAAGISANVIITTGSGSVPGGGIVSVGGTSATIFSGAYGNGGAGGNGGSGGMGTSGGGSGASAGNGGADGKVGNVTINSNNSAINILGYVGASGLAAGDGGAGGVGNLTTLSGNGGKGGNGGSGGKAAQGGVVTINAGNADVSAGVVMAEGGKSGQGAPGGGGGGSMKGGNGGQGGNGGNGGAGAAGGSVTITGGAISVSSFFVDGSIITGSGGTGGSGGGGAVLAGNGGNGGNAGSAAAGGKFTANSSSKGITVGYSEANGTNGTGIAGAGGDAGFAPAGGNGGNGGKGASAAAGGNVTLNATGTTANPTLISAVGGMQVNGNAVAISTKASGGRSNYGNGGNGGTGSSSGNGGKIAISAKYGSVLLQSINAAGGNNDGQGGDGGAGSFNANPVLLTAASAAGGKGGNGGNTGTAGNGGIITVTATGNMALGKVVANFLNASGGDQTLNAYSGRGGDGGIGGKGGGAGGAGGFQAASGAGGSISITANAISGSNFNAHGGVNDGLGSAGGIGGAAVAGTSGAGGKGGGGAGGGAGGKLTFTAGVDIIVTDGNASGGNNSFGVAGGGDGGGSNTLKVPFAVASTSAGGAGATTVAAAAGGKGGTITAKVNSGNASLAGFRADGGDGAGTGIEGYGGAGGTSAVANTTNGGAGAAGAPGSKGGNGGSITISATGTIVADGLSVVGAPGGSGDRGGNGGNAGIAGLKGGAGGKGGAAGAAGNGGTINLATKGASISSKTYAGGTYSLTAQGGDNSPLNFGTGGKGGNGGTVLAPGAKAGVNGAGGAGGVGGSGGKVAFTTGAGGSVTVLGAAVAAQGGDGGNGGDAGVTGPATGVQGGVGGKGGVGGAVTVQPASVMPPPRVTTDGVDGTDGADH